MSNFIIPTLALDGIPLRFGQEPSIGKNPSEKAGPTTPDWSCYQEAFRELQLLRILIKALGGWLHQCDFE
jgi:hypothetical protein